MKLCGIAGVCLLAMTTTVYAEDKNGRFNIKGAGAETCEAYMAAKSGTAESASAFTHWLEGYLTAINQTTADTFDLTSWESTDLLVTVTELHCKKHPADQLVSVANSIVNQLKADRLRDQSTLVVAGAGDQSMMIYRETLRRVQEKLADMDLYMGKTEGMFNDHTRQAIKLFQQQQQLPVTSLPDQITLWNLIRPGKGPLGEAAQP